jgi:hypothetical protein
LKNRIETIIFGENVEKLLPWGRIFSWGGDLCFP